MLDYVTKFAAEESSGGIAALGLDPLAILIQSGTFILLFFLIKRYALDKINNALNDREETIQEGLENAHKAEIASREAVVEQKKIMKEAHLQAEQVLADANKQAGELLQAAQNNADKKTDAMLQDARSQIQAEVEKARQELKKETLSLVAAASTYVLGEKMDSDKDKQLIDKALSEVRR